MYSPVSQNWRSHNFETYIRKNICQVPDGRVDQGDGPKVGSRASETIDMEDRESNPEAHQYFASRTAWLLENLSIVMFRRLLHSADRISSQ